MAKTIADILVGKGILQLQEAAESRKEAKEKGISLEEVLYQKGVSQTDVVTAKSEVTGFPVKDLHGTNVPFDVLQDIPEESAQHYAMVPLGRREGFLDVGMLYPENVDAQDALKFISSRIGLPTRIFVISLTDFQNIIREYKGLSGEVTNALGEFEKEFKSRDDVRINIAEPTKITADAPVTKMVSVILRHAVEGGASDIHIEPLRDKLRVRFRVDGVLHTSLLLPVDVHSAVVSRIKVMTNLKIDESRIPQDGRFHDHILDRDIDFRVSTFPTAFGEKVVIRILDPEAGIHTLSDIGLAGRNLTSVQEGLKRPYGLILVTGPTGSGKSTTLYAMMQILNQERSNIVSLEDPIEYYIQGVNQSQIRPEIHYTFATGLRSILRQDPDIIMVGEIRDKETAAMAIHSALTGHLVLSTLHTNNALGVIPRLIDMGVDPFLLPATLILVIGQRLTRKLCPDSRKPIPVEGKVAEILAGEISSFPEQFRTELDGKLPKEVYRAEASAICPKGTRGRMGIFEVLSMTPRLEKIILTQPGEAEIAKEAALQGMVTMRQDGITKVLNGLIGMEELLEVV